MRYSTVSIDLHFFFLNYCTNTELSTLLTFCLKIGFKGDSKNCCLTLLNCINAIASKAVNYCHSSKVRKNSKQILFFAEIKSDFFIQ